MIQNYENQPLPGSAFDVSNTNSNLHLARIFTA